MQALPAVGGEALEVVIRSATVADARVLATLLEALNVSEGDPTGYVTAETMARDLARGQISVVLAERAGAALGYCLYHFGYEATYAASGFYICDLYVRPEARGRGVARALMAEVARRSKAAGGTFIWWTSRPQNAQANALYERLEAYREPLLAHAVFDAPFDALVAEGEARRRD
jgi:ribosomal protein S18 acetylase RimI-like enzyme